MTCRILIGDVRDRLRELPDESVHCVVTSPPYWGLRCYGVEGRLGLEPTPEEHGTVGLVADRFGRDSILIELNEEYAEMARRRIRDDAPLFAKVEVE